MNPSTAKIRTAFDRIVRVLKTRSAAGRGTAISTARILDGYRCEIQDGAWAFEADLSAKSGGDGSAPDPGVFGRAALSSCLAMCYMRWAAALDVPLSDVEVRVEADYNARPEYGLSDEPAGYTEVRYEVNIASEAPAEAVQRVIDMADAHSSYLDIFCHPQRVRQTVNLTTLETA